MGSTIGILSGVTRLAVLVGHAAESGRGRGDRSGSRACGCRNADGILADGRVAVSAGAISVGAAPERNGRGRWSGGRSNTDIVRTSPAGTAVGTVGVRGAAESKAVGAVGVADRGSRGKSSKCYESKGGDCCVVHRN